MAQRRWAVATLLVTALVSGALSVMLRHGRARAPVTAEVVNGGEASSPARAEGPASRPGLAPAPFLDQDVPCVVVGKVRDAFGDPADGARIRCGGAIVATTGFDGAFSCIGDAESVTVHRVGHLPKTVAVLREGTSGVLLDAGEIRLFGDAVLKVRLVDENGDRASTGRVGVERAGGGTRMRSAGRVSMEADVDPEGVATLATVPSSTELLVTASVDGATSAIARTRLAPGENRLTMVVHAARTLTLRGVGPDGPVRGRFQVRPIDGPAAGAWSYRSADAESVATLRLPKGRYLAIAEGLCPTGQKREVVELSEDRDIAFRWAFALAIHVGAVDVAGAPIGAFDAAARLVDDLDADVVGDVSDAAAPRDAKGRDGSATWHLVGDDVESLARSTRVAIAARGAGRFAALARVPWDAARARVDVRLTLREHAGLDGTFPDLEAGGAVGLWLAEPSGIRSLRDAPVLCDVARIGGDRRARFSPPFEGRYFIAVDRRGAQVGSSSPPGAEAHVGVLGEISVHGAGPWSFTAPASTGSLEVVVDRDSETQAEAPLVFGVRHIQGLGGGAFREGGPETGRFEDGVWRYRLPAGDYVVFHRSDVPEAWRTLAGGAGRRASVSPAATTRVVLGAPRNRTVRWRLGGAVPQGGVEWCLLPALGGATSERNVEWRALTQDGSCEASIDPVIPHVLVVRRLSARYEPRFSRPERDVVHAQKFAEGADIDGRTVQVPETVALRFAPRAGSMPSAVAWSSTVAGEVLADGVSHFEPWPGEAVVARGPSEIRVSGVEPGTGRRWTKSVAWDPDHDGPVVVDLAK